MPTISSTLLAESVDIHPGESDSDGTHDSFPCGASFSPDGLCVLTSTGGRLRLYNVFENDCDANKPRPWTAQVKTSQGGDTVRSYAWYPRMNSNDPATCCFIGTSRDQPVHLYDAYTGQVRASYCPYNALEELESATVLHFSQDFIWAAGFRTDRVIHKFDTSRPGRQSAAIYHLGKTRRSSDGQKGLVSAMAFQPSSVEGTASNPIFAIGTYSPGSIYVYDERVGKQATGTIWNGVCVVGHGRSHSRKKRRFDAITQNEENGEHGTWFSTAKVKWFLERARGGITQLDFSKKAGQEYILYSSSRRSNAILTWDLRSLSGNEDFQSSPIKGIGSFETNNRTNQRLEFDQDHNGERIFAGGLDHCVRIYDASSCDMLGSIGGFKDAVNGVSFFHHSALKKSFLTVATGSRHFPTEADMDGDQLYISNAKCEASLQLYSLETPTTEESNKGASKESDDLA